MKLQHTLGGLEGLDPVAPELRVFVDPWETRIFGIHTAMMALSPQLKLPATPSAFKTVWTWADLRKGAELMNPFDYFKYRYYEKWLGGISGYFVANGYITQKELDDRTAVYLANPRRRCPRAALLRSTRACASISGTATRPWGRALRSRNSQWARRSDRGPANGRAHQAARLPAQQEGRDRRRLSRRLRLSLLDGPRRRRSGHALLLREVRPAGPLARQRRAGLYLLRRSLRGLRQAPRLSQPRREGVRHDRALRISRRPGSAQRRPGARARSAAHRKGGYYGRDRRQDHGRVHDRDGAFQRGEARRPRLGRSRL